MPKYKLSILITAGPTVEAIDPVRYLTNHSSGKMGYALAKAAVDLGHKVILISGPTGLVPPRGCRVITVESARAMEQAVLKHFAKSQVIIKTAAVADYRPVSIHSQKIKKTGATLMLRLVRNPDILKQLGMRKRADQTLIGFAAETQKLIKNAEKKIYEKNLDWIVLNDVSRKDIGFGSDQNAVTLISKNGLRIAFAKQDKMKLANALLKIILSKKKANQKMVRL